MKCQPCHGNIRAGQEELKRVEFWQTELGVRVFGHHMPDGPLSAAHGRLLYAMHSKCFHTLHRAQERAHPLKKATVADPGHGDWREPVTLAIEELVGDAGNGGDRGAAAPGG